MTEIVDEKEAQRKAKNAEKMRLWRKKNPSSPEKRAVEAERVRRWRETHPERYRALQTAWNRKFRERAKVEASEEVT
ncbi:hypothetical protein GF108_14450 [Phyllobacterium sp. SYP-B3895]|uniref:hypothetical protein n=1 Tax=Phyllobacterium sp. SYP-B3895 TaxID=2663240 RepID=UPI0012997185|nr:hypothetical protein [Phyllobacterium sp. SYP-B3895]MRG56777.1 hypothetical protein [Phyllobacterium sp. SYP-B3895]